MRNECEVLVGIKKVYVWQLEEHPKIAGVVSLVGSCGWDQSGSRAWSHSSCWREGGWGQPALQGNGAFLRVGPRCLLLTGRRPCHTELQKLYFPPTPVIVKSCTLLHSRSRLEA